jgi:hypothetical protein
MNWLNRFLLANWSWLMDGMLLLMALIIGMQIGESHVQKEWSAEKSKNEQITAKMEQHVEDVKLMQTQINQEITNDFLKKSKLLAERLPHSRFVGLCNIPTASDGDVSSVSEAPAKFYPSSNNYLPSTNRDPIDPSNSQILHVATHTTLMFIELQRWHEMQSKATK